MANDEVGQDGGAAPRAIVRAKARPSIVWLIPLIAALVGRNRARKLRSCSRAPRASSLAKQS